MIYNHYINNKRQRKPKGQSRIENPETLTTLGTQNTRRRPHHKQMICFLCSCARKRQILFCKTPLWFYQKVLWNWYLQYARVFDWQHIWYVWWTCFSTDSRHTYGYKLCSSSRRFVLLFVWGRLHNTKRS